MELDLNLKMVDGNINQPPLPIVPNTLSGLYLWNKSDSGIVLDGGGLITAWNDLSGNSFSFAANGTSPLYVASDAQYNGLPSLSVPTQNGSIGMRTSTNQTYGAYTKFIVAKFSAPQSTAYMFVHSPDNVNGDFLVGVAGTTQSYAEVGGIAGGGSIAGDTYSIPLIWCQTFNGTNASQTLRQNGVTKTLTPVFTGDPGLAGTSGRCYCFKTQGATGLNASGSLAELIIYNRLLSASEIQGVEKYLSNRYAISLGS